MSSGALFNGRGRVIASRFAPTTGCHVHNFGQIKRRSSVVILDDDALWLRILIFLTRIFLFLRLSRAAAVAVIFLLEAYLAWLTSIMSSRWWAVGSLEVEGEGTSQTVSSVIATIWRHHMVDPIARFFKNRSDRVYTILIFILDRDMMVFGAVRRVTILISHWIRFYLVLNSSVSWW